MNEIANMADVSNLFFCSLPMETDEQKAFAFNVMNSADQRLADHINEEISVTDFFCETVMLDRKLPDGQIITEPQPRIVLVDVAGVSYQCVSAGIFSALKRLVYMYGEPTWSTPIKIRVKQVNKNDKKMLTFELVR